MFVCVTISLVCRFDGVLGCGQLATATAAQFVLVLFPEAVTNREEVPASLLVHVPHVRFLTGVLGVRFVD